MKEEYSEAFSEVDKIISLMPPNLASKIPLGFKKIINEEKLNSYIPNITEPIEQCKLKDETTIILALIYRDFLCSKEERDNLIEKDSNNLSELEKELQEKYNIDNIFKSRTAIIHTQEESQTEQFSIIEYKEKSFLKRLFDKIKHLFKNPNY